MNPQQAYLRIVSGEAGRAGATLARGGLALLEPAYRAAVAIRNLSFDLGWRNQATLERPVISVGNLTVGGTGKTPLVAWLCEQLQKQDLAPAVLMRGYKARAGEPGDEERLLRTLLADSVPIAANPNRVAGAAGVLQEWPDVRVFVLDDGFQHRSVRRAVDLVLIDATRPFGHGHQLPRGLLREPISALRRASGVILTRAGLVPADTLQQVRDQIARVTQALVLECNFLPDGYVDATGSVFNELPDDSVLHVCGIGNPQAFANDLLRSGLHLAGSIEFEDHHYYTADDVKEIRRAAKSAGAPVVTTMKDWVKLRPLWPAGGGTRIYIARQRPEFAPGDDARLMQLVLTLHG